MKNMLYVINTLILLISIIALKFNVIKIADNSPIGEGIYTNNLYWLPALTIILLLILNISYYKRKEQYNLDNYYRFMNLSFFMGLYTLILSLSYELLTLYLILGAIVVNDFILNILFKTKKISYIPIVGTLSLITLILLHEYNGYKYNGNGLYLDMSIIPIFIKEYISLFLMYLSVEIFSRLNVRKWIKVYSIAFMTVLVLIGTNFALYYYEANNVSHLKTFRIKYYQFLSDMAKDVAKDKTENKQADKITE